ncbi:MULTISPECIES: 5-amino-6-(5-phospho-D-ribitylamino)uracil phosphatase YigB [unclassified Rahnella]|uniref:5-amino-6-(5-phospho-D-ribitylamino)uracil phosphatase YigB n=1 Tax=unclassified Rahnella TaxID=2635087 RepID=UPI00101FB12C|nr:MULTISPECIES: 5-amino-6-(5-phospho-D-ribitylamino)uracil phosphatase YigB [unclassified Rahnella]
MKFYRPLKRIEAITFDLDDTLYDNYDVIRRTDAETLKFMQGYHPALADIAPDAVRLMRAELLAQDAEIYHDVTEWRRQAVLLAMTRAGLSHSEAEQGTKATMETFAKWRSRIYVPQENHDALAALAERWPLVAITNGNADPTAFGLSQYFQFTLRAGDHGRAKPYADMYKKTSMKLDIPLENILHVGDDLTTDVAGSVRCGMQSCWINLREGDLMHIKDARLLPHIEISQLASLTALL